jgi:PAS domain S-box-containing protein
VIVEFLRTARLVREPLVLVTVEADIVGANPAGAEWFGEDALTGRRLGEFVTEDNATLRERLHEWSAAEEPVSGHVTLRRSDEPVRSQLRAAAYPPVEGLPPLVVLRHVADDDHTERFGSLLALLERLEETSGAHRRTSEQLLRSEMLLGTILELTKSSLFAKDLEGRYIACNEPAASITGYTVEEILGHTDAELYDAEVAARFREHDLAAIERGAPVTEEIPIPTVNGTEIWLSTLAPLVDSEGTTYGVAGVATDMTERIRAERLLAERTAELAEAQRIAGLGSFAWSIETGEVDMSDELCHLLGVEPGRTWHVDDLMDRVAEDEQSLARAALDSFVRARPSTRVEREVQYRHEDGSIRWLTFRIEPNEEEAASRVVGTVLDVTAARLAERERRGLAERLQRAQRLETVGQLAGGIAHDFNNVLAVVNLQAELAASTLPADHPAVANLATIRTSLRAAVSITQQLLLFSRRDVATRHHLDLNELIDDLRVLLEGATGEAILLSTELDPALPAVIANRGQLEQVLLNLVVNARDATPDGGHVAISTRAERDEAGSWAVLSVRDDGAGMPREVRDRAVEPFFTTKEATGGSGLGLSTVHGIVTSLGGTLHIDSAPGRGTEITLRLPADPAAAANQDLSGALRVPVDPGHDRCVLVVEDVVDLADSIVSVLRDAGYQAWAAYDGDQAIELAARLDRIDLILTDVVMPGLSGPQVVDVIRSARPDTRVLYASGYTRGLLDDRIGDGDTELLAKPFTTEELLLAVQRALSADG